MRTIRMVVTTRDGELREWFRRFSPPAGQWVLETRCTASIPQAALLAQDEDTRLVLLDDTAVEKGGLARAARRIRAAQRVLSVVCVISRPSPAIEVELRQMGVLFIAVRPINLSLLDRVLRKALQSDTRKYYKPGTPPVGVPALPATLET